MKLDIRPFSAKDDLAELHQWLALRGCYLPKASELPQRGWIASLDGQDIAVNFLRLVEGGFAQSDGLCTNPWQEKALRHHGIEAVVEATLNCAKELGITQILAVTSDAGTLMRSSRHGYVHHPHLAVMTCNLLPR